MIVGGEGHPVGRGGPTGPRYDRLESFVARALRLRPGHSPLVGAGQLCSGRRAARRKADATLTAHLGGHRVPQVGARHGSGGRAADHRRDRRPREPLAGASSTRPGSRRAPPPRRSSPRTPPRASTSSPTVSPAGARTPPRTSPPAKDGSPPGTAARSRSPAATTARSTPCRRAAPTSAASSPGTTPSRPGTAPATRPGSLRTDRSCKVPPCTRWLSGSRSAGARAWQERAVSEWGLLARAPA